MLLATTALAWLSFRYLERPMFNLWGIDSRASDGARLATLLRW